MQQLHWHRGAVVILGVLAVGCAQPQPSTPIPRPNHQIESFGLAGTNALVSVDRSALVVTAQVPIETDRRTLRPTFQVSPGATVRVGSQTQVSGVTVRDLRQTVPYTVVAEDGTQATYQVRVSSLVTPIAGGHQGQADGVGSEAQFYDPKGTIVVGDFAYVADSQKSVIRRINLHSQEVVTMFGSGTAGTADGLGTAAQFMAPSNLATDGRNLFVSDEQAAFRKIDLATGQVTTIPGSLSGVGQREGIVLVQGSLYFADSSRHVIYQLDPTSGAKSVVAGTSGTAGAVDGVGLAARFNNPWGLCSDGTFLYVADLSNQLIRRIDLGTFEVSTVAGLAGTAGETDGVGTSARITQPTALASDGQRLYVAENSGGVRVIWPASGEVQTLVAAHGWNQTTKESLALDASFGNLWGLALDQSRLILSDKTYCTVFQVH